MKLLTTREIILALKKVKAERHLSIPRIQRMVEDSGVYIAINTFRNVFAKGSENGSFSYERTILPIADVLLPGVIDENREENEMLEQQLELLTKQLQNEREEHKRNYEFMQARIDNLKKTIDEKDNVIKQLLEKCL